MTTPFTQPVAPAARQARVSVPLGARAALIPFLNMGRTNERPRFVQRRKPRVLPVRGALREMLPHAFRTGHARARPRAAGLFAATSPPLDRRRRHASARTLVRRGEPTLHRAVPTPPAWFDCGPHHETRLKGKTQCQIMHRGSTRQAARFPPLKDRKNCTARCGRAIPNTCGHLAQNRCRARSKAARREQSTKGEKR